MIPTLQEGKVMAVVAVRWGSREGVAWFVATDTSDATETTTMNTYIRHLLTFLAGIGTILATKGLIPADQASTVNEAGGQLIQPLAIIIGIVAVGVARALISWAQKWFGKPDNGGEGFYVHPVTFVLSAVLAVAAAVLLGACTTVTTDAKGGMTKTEFLPPAAFWEVLGNLAAKDNDGGTIPVVKVRAEK